MPLAFFFLSINLRSYDDVFNELDHGDSSTFSTLWRFLSYYHVRGLGFGSVQSCTRLAQYQAVFSRDRASRWR